MDCNDVMQTYPTADYRRSRFRRYDGDQEPVILKFSPTLCEERYWTVRQVLEDLSSEISLETIADVGCGACIFSRKFLLPLSFVKRCHLLDINEGLLRGSLPYVNPSDCSEVSRDVQVNVYCGSISEMDDRLSDTDAVVGIEMIEHLYAEQFDQFPAMVFGFLKPKVAIFTTPNRDFNPLFNLITTFRHHDHKFEFSMEEFRGWVDSVTAKFPEYESRIYGIGKPPVNFQHVGHGSQMVIFKRKSSTSHTVSGIGKQSYKLLKRYNYKHMIIPIEQTEEEKILNFVFSVVCNYGVREEFVEYYMKTECQHVVTYLPLWFILDKIPVQVSKERLCHVLKEARFQYSVLCRDVIGDILVIEDQCEYENCEFAGKRCDGEKKAL